MLWQATCCIFLSMRLVVCNSDCIICEPVFLMMPQEMKTISTCLLWVHLHLSNFVQFLGTMLDAKIKLWFGAD